MELLYKREQAKTLIRRKVCFKLWAKAELTDEEHHLIRKYDMDNAMLVPVPSPGLLKASFVVALFAFLIMFACIFYGVHIRMGIYIRIPMTMNTIISAIFGALAGILYYTQMRQTIYVKDLIHGRSFKCRSVIELARQEAFMETVTGYFRQVLESAKHWGGTEKMPIEPLPPKEAKQFILSGPLL